MLYHFFYWLTSGNVHYAYGGAGFRAVVAVITAFLIVWALGPRVIRKLVQMKIGDRPEFDHADLNRLTRTKENTPTMGGALIAVAIAVTMLLLGNLTNFYVVLGLFCLVWLTALGAIDDYLKLTAHRRSGTRVRGSSSRFAAGPASHEQQTRAKLSTPGGTRCDAHLPNVSRGIDDHFAAKLTIRVATHAKRLRVVL